MILSNILINKDFNIVKRLSSLCSLVQTMNYVKRAKLLDNFKSNSVLHDNIYEKGKYMVLIKSDLVCLEGNKLFWKNFQELMSLSFNDVPQKLLLDISSNSNSEDICLFAADFNCLNDNDIKILQQKAGGIFVNVRESLLRLNQCESQYVAKAKGLSHFNRTFNFCPNCGTELLGNAIGTFKECQKCNKVSYPHVAPVGIVLIENSKHNKVLLVRQGRHPPGMYSCVAGFLEPGETLYQGIEREVAEEVGLKLTQVEFCNSHPWAMPASQLMLACRGTVDEEHFDIDKKEIEDAMWVSADALRDALEHVNSMKTILNIDNKKVFWVPPSFTASHQLMIEWLKKYHYN